MTGGYWYVATPYAKYAKGHQAAFDLSCRAAAFFLASGLQVFAPIAHSHPVADYLPDDKRCDHDFWMWVDRPLMEGAMGLIVVTAEGWAESRGVAEEIATFTKAGKPILYWSPEDEVADNRGTEDGEDHFSATTLQGVCDPIVPFNR